MAKFNVEIREVLSKVIVVEANNEVSAKKFAVNAYKNAENRWILGADDCVERSLAVVNSDGEYELFKSF